MVKGITKRWFFNVFGVIFVLLVCVCFIISKITADYYYNSVSSYITNRINTVNGFFRSYILEKEASYNAGAKKAVESFENADRMEFQMLDISGNILYSTVAYNNSTQIDSEQLDYLLSGETKAKVFQNGDEKILLINRNITDQKGTQLGAMRILVSMDEVDRAIENLIILYITGSALILLLVFISNMYFIRSIVRPMRQINKTTALMSKGNLNVRITNKYNDEIGELCNSINQMAIGLSQTDKLKNDFLSSVSHELRTPLTSIKGWSETMLMSDPVTEKDIYDKGLSVINEETDRLSVMVEELLDFSRINEGKFKMTFEKADLATVCTHTVAMFAERAAHEIIRLTVDIKDEETYVYMDKNRIKQVLINIIDNAIKHSNKGGEIIVSLEQKADKALIKVRDFGKGIPAKDLPEIKKKFYKANSTVRGAGLGLSISDSIVASHNGSLEIDSEENKGTTVTITLPLYKGEKNERN